MKYELSVELINEIFKVLGAQRHVDVWQVIDRMRFELNEQDKARAPKENQELAAK